MIRDIGMPIKNEYKNVISVPFSLKNAKRTKDIDMHIDMIYI
jgi:hypothetical protein